MIKRLKLNGAQFEDLTDVYVKQLRSILEFGTRVWSSNLTQEEVLDIERVQKSFLHIALENMYINYESALDKMNLETLKKNKYLLEFCYQSL